MRYIYGTADDDLLEGGEGGDSLYGKGGDDIIRGFAGNDVLQGSDGRDTLDGGEGGDLAFYTDKSLPVHVSLAGSEAATVYVGGIAEDTIRNIEKIISGSGDDTLVGDEQSNGLQGEGGDDVIYGKGGDDALSGDAGNDILDGGAGEDWAFYMDKSLPVRVTLTGSEETATVYVGDVAEDTIRNIEGIFGGSSHDILTGDEQDNALVGWAGQDVLSGKSGSDRFVYMDPSNGGDTIQDFSSDEGDQIDLNFSLYPSDDQSLVFSESTPAPFSVWYEAAGHTKDLSVKADTDGDEKTVEFSITLAGVTSLTADDFIF